MSRQFAKGLTIAAAAMAALIFATTPVGADLIAFEDFESYAPATDISGGAGGIGWTANWTGVAGDATVQSGVIDGYGKSLCITDSGGTDPIVKREFTATSGTVYLGLLLKSTALANDEFFQTYLTSATGNNTTGASTGLRNNADNPLFARIRDYSSNGATHNSSISGDDGVTRQLVLKVTKTGAYGADYDQSELFIDQLTEGAPDATTALAGGPKDSLVSSFVRFGIRTHQLDLDADFIYVDEIRIATTYSEALAVPEPCTFALMAVGLSGLQASGRRRKR